MFHIYIIIYYYFNHMLHFSSKKRNGHLDAVRYVYNSWGGCLNDPEYTTNCWCSSCTSSWGLLCILFPCLFVENVVLFSFTWLWRAESPITQSFWWKWHPCIEFFLQSSFSSPSPCPAGQEILFCHFYYCYFIIIYVVIVNYYYYYIFPTVGIIIWNKVTWKK